jgi:hypothetical protein
VRASKERPAAVVRPAAPRMIACRDTQGFPFSFDGYGAKSKGCGITSNMNPAAGCTPVATVVRYWGSNAEPSGRALGITWQLGIPHH